MPLVLKLSQSSKQLRNLVVPAGFVHSITLRSVAVRSVNNKEMSANIEKATFYQKTYQGAAMKHFCQTLIWTPSLTQVTSKRQRVLE